MLEIYANPQKHFDQSFADDTTKMQWEYIETGKS